MADCYSVSCPGPCDVADALKHERDRAIETRENANAVSLRLEAENTRLRDVVTRAATAALHGDAPGAWSILDAALSREDKGG